MHEGAAPQPRSSGSAQEEFMTSTVHAPITPAAAIRRMRISWEIKAVLPVALVLLNGLVLFVLATVSLQRSERHVVLMVASAGAVAICAVMSVVLAILIQRPIVELQEKIAQVGTGDLAVEVDFDKRNDEIGDLGRNFN